MTPDILILQGFKGNLGFLYYMDVSEINDIRMPPQFRGVSFSNYKKTDVKNEFVSSMLNGRWSKPAIGQPNSFVPAII